LRERTELAQLRAENRRLRGQIEAMDALRTAPRRIDQAVRWATSAFTFFCRHCGVGATSQ
jgi:hypothetical protein